MADVYIKYRVIIIIFYKVYFYIISLTKLDGFLITHQLPLYCQLIIVLINQYSNAFNSLMSCKFKYWGWSTLFFFRFLYVMKHWITWMRVVMVMVMSQNLGLCGGQCFFGIHDYKGFFVIQKMVICHEMRIFSQY